MKNILTVENMRNSDAATIALGISGQELMHRAGLAILNTLENEGLLDDREIAIVCGSGNNAGDGYVLAYELALKGIESTLYLPVEKFSVDGGFYYDLCQRMGIETIICSNDFYMQFIQRYKRGKSLIVDCLLGTGFTGTPREPIQSVIEQINSIRADFDNIFVASVDINSGLNGDNGLAACSVISDLTISIGDLMPGLYLNSAKDYIGKIINVDIGINPVDKPYHLLEREDVVDCLPDRLNNSNKGSYGYMALIGGSYKYSGAITLASLANAAMRSGAGVVMVAAPRTVCDFVIPKILESTVYPLKDIDGELVFDKGEMDGLINRVDVIAFGMGVGNTEESLKTLEYIMNNYSKTLIVDADGLNCLARMDDSIWTNCKCNRVILTPHPKEFSRLSGKSMEEIRNHPIELVIDYAKKTRAIVLLKGATTTVTDGEEVYLVDRGCPGMATAGSGDVLSGILAAMCGYNKQNLLEATAAAAFINGYAGELAQKEIGSISMIASDTIAYLPQAIKNVVYKL